MKFELKEYHRNISKDDLIMDLQHVAKKLNKNTVTIDDYETYGRFHPTTLIRRLGSWFEILNIAGLEPSRSSINISNEELFSNLQDLWIKLGRQPKYSEIKKPFSKYSAGTYEKRFGSFRKALVAFVEFLQEDVKHTNSNISNEAVDILYDENKKQKHKTKRDVSDRMRFRILMRDGFSCKRCGRSPVKELGVELHVDHIIPWSKGGETVIENLETKCEKCNLGKGNEFEV